MKCVLFQSSESESLESTESPESTSEDKVGLIVTFFFFTHSVHLIFQFTPLRMTVVTYFLCEGIILQTNNCI